MTSSSFSRCSIALIQARIHLIKLYLYWDEYIEAKKADDERRQQVETPHPKGSVAERDYIDGYLDYFDNYRERQPLHCPSDRSPHYRQGWEAYAAQDFRWVRSLMSDAPPESMRSLRIQ